MGNPNSTESRLECMSLIKQTTEITKPSDINHEISKAMTGGKRVGAYLISEVHVDALGNAAGLPVRGTRKAAMEGYDPANAGMLIVALYNGSLSIINGFVRRASAKAAGYTHVLCGIVTGLNPQDMARMRLELNDNLPARTRFALAVKAGHGLETSIEEALELNGMSAFVSSRTIPNQPVEKFIMVNGTGELISIMKDNAAGGDCLADIIRFLNDTGWKGLPDGTSVTVLKGLHLAWVSINSQGLLKNGWPALIASMQNEMPRHLLFTARKRAMELPNHTAAEHAAEMFVKIMLNAQYGTRAFQEP